MDYRPSPILTKEKKRILISWIYLAKQRNFHDALKIFLDNTPETIPSTNAPGSYNGNEKHIKGWFVQLKNI